MDADKHHWVNMVFYTDGKIIIMDGLPNSHTKIGVMLPLKYAVKNMLIIPFGYGFSSLE